MDWPAVGGGGSMFDSLDDDALFQRLCAWDDENYILGCDSMGASDKEDHDGVVGMLELRDSHEGCSE